jgi:hypothetical protein
MAKTQRSLIPPDKQVPVMIVSAIIFAIILWWRFGPKPVETGAALALIPTAVATGDTASLDELKALSGDLAALEKPGSSWPEWRTEITRDPFHWPRMADGDVVEQGAEAPAGDTSAADDGATALALSGVILDGRGGMALINGKYVRIGDSVEGCLVRAIGETSVTVEDSSGTRELYLPEVGQQ